MSLRRIFLLAMCYVLAVQANLASRHAELKNILKPDTSAKIARRQEQEILGVQQQPDRPVPNAYLNKKTRPYWIAGHKLPEVNFNIGESYGGLLPVDDMGRELYFWFVPSINPAAKNEIVIWFNGGPGCSSLLGLLHEHGPFLWQPGTYLPVPNTWSWSNLTNVVYIDQPVGTGFSRGEPSATNEIEIARQLLAFWTNFVDLFDLHGREVYITGESYAGQYSPYIADAMLNRRDKEYFNLTGMMIYDPSIQYDVAFQSATMPFVNTHLADFPFNQTWRAALVNGSKACGYDEYLANGLQFPPKKPFYNPPARNYSYDQGGIGRSTDDCDVFDAVFEEMFFINPCFSIYNIGQGCPLQWDVLGFPYSGHYFPIGYKDPYFNRSDVKAAIHAPPNTNWQPCSSKPVFASKTKKDQSPPSGIRGGPLMRVIEATNNVIVGHGDLDMILIANGTLLTLNNLTWNGKQGFSKPPIEPFYVPYHVDPIMGSIAGAGVLGGYVTERGLTFVVTVLAGHEIPEYQPSASYRHLEFLLGRISSLKEISSFTTQDVPQNFSAADLGPGTWWPSTETGLGY